MFLNNPSVAFGASSLYTREPSTQKAFFSVSSLFFFSSVNLLGTPPLWRGFRYTIKKSGYPLFFYLQ